MLAFSVVTCTTTFTGCSALGGGPSVELAYGFAIDNASRDAATVHVEISIDETTHYDADHDIEAAVYESSDNEYPTRTSGTRVELKDWSNDAAAYTVRATLDDGTTDETQIAEEWSESCVIPQIYITPQGNPLIRRYSCDLWAEATSATTERES